MPRLHSEVCDRHLPRTGTDFRLLRKSASRSTDGRRLPIRQPGGERAETAVSRLDHSAVDNRSSRHHGRRRYPSVSAERLHKPARRHARLLSRRRSTETASGEPRGGYRFRSGRNGTERLSSDAHRTKQDPTASGRSMTQSPSANYRGTSRGNGRAEILFQHENLRKSEKANEQHDVQPCHESADGVKQPLGRARIAEFSHHLLRGSQANLQETVNGS